MMLTAHLKEISIVDNVVGENGIFIQEVPFNVPIHLSIGTSGVEGGDLFVSSICNKAWLDGEINRSGVMSGLKTFVVGHCTHQELELFIRGMVSEINGMEWNEIVGKLASIGDWEFAGMR